MIRDDRMTGLPDDKIRGPDDKIRGKMSMCQNRWIMTGLFKD